MKTVYLLRYSQLSRSDIRKSVEAFLQHTGIHPSMLQAIVHQEGGLPLSSYTPEEMTWVSKGAIYLYKTGQISDDAFIEEMNDIMGADLDPEIFKNCWNAMCKIQPETFEFLREVEHLQKTYGFGLHVIGDTNLMQDKYLNKQFASEGIALEMSHTFSFEVGRLNPEPPKTTDAGWENVNIIDLRNTADILAEFRAFGLIEDLSDLEEPTPRRAALR